MKQLISMICFLPLFTSAQRVKTSIDKLTGDTITYSTNEQLVSELSNAMNFSLSKEKRQNTLQLEVWLQEYLPKVQKGSELNFRLTNGQIITLHTTQTFDYKPREFYYGKPVDLTKGVLLSPRYILDDNVINQLKSSPVALIRFHYDTTYRDYEIEPNKASKFLKAMQLIY